MSSEEGLGKELFPNCKKAHGGTACPWSILVKNMTQEEFALNEKLLGVDKLVFLPENYTIKTVRSDPVTDERLLDVVWCLRAKNRKSFEGCHFNGQIQNKRHWNMTEDEAVAYLREIIKSEKEEVK